RSYRAAWLLALSLAVMAYTSGYLIVFAAVMLAVSIVTRVPDWWPRLRRVLPPVLLAGAIASLAILPVYLPYRRVPRDQHMVRTLDAVRDFSATPAGYLATAGRLHFATWSGRFFKDPVDAFFPGFTILALVLVALVVAGRRDGDATLRRRVAMLVAIG